MKKRTQLFTMMGMLTLVTVSLMGTADASSFNNKMKERGLNDPIAQAIEEQNYQAFLSAKKKTGRALAGISISEAQFKRLVEAHTLLSEGKKREANAIMIELGIEKTANAQKRGGSKAAFPILTDAQKKAFDEAHELRRAGNHEAAQKVLADADITFVARGKAQ